MGCNAWMDVAITFEKGEQDDELLAWADEHRFTLVKPRDGSTFTVAGDGEAGWFDAELDYLREEMSTIPAPLSAWRAEVSYSYYDEPHTDGCFVEFGIVDGKLSGYRESRIVMVECEPDFEFDLTEAEA